MESTGFDNFETQLTHFKSPSKMDVNSLFVHYKNERYDLAEELAKTITLKYPDHLLSWKILTAIFQKTGRLDQLVIANKRIAEISPNDSDVHFILGNTLQKLDRLEEAEASYRKAIGLKEDYVVAYNNLGIILEKFGRLGEAEAEYKKAITLNPGYAESYFNLGNTLQKLDRAKEAEALYRKAITIKPDYAEAYNNLGNSLQELGRLLDAEASYSKAIAIKPEYAEAYNNFGNTLQELRRLDEAEACYSKAIAIKPDYAQAYSNLGNMLQKIGRLEEAEASYRKAIAIIPEYAEAHSNLGTTMKKIGRLEEAEASYRKAIAVKPDFSEAYSNLATTLHELGKIEEAEASYRQAVYLKTDYEATEYNLGIWYCEQGKYNEATELLLRVRNYKNSQSFLLKCWYFLGNQALFYDLLKTLTSQGITDAIIGSLGCRAQLKFTIEKPNLFCENPLNYVFKIDLNKKYDFEEKFVNPVLQILNDQKLNNRFQNLLINGFQTSGNLFAIKNKLIDEIKISINQEIENYRLYFKDSTEGLIKNWPDSYHLHGWLIRMKNGGALRPHMHENGWISGSVYINVPPKLNMNDGNLVVCIEDDELLSETEENKKNIIDVTTGSLCLFPASLLHYTVPFESDEERIVLAFDVVPNKMEA